MKKRLLAMLLAIAMVCALLPANALAAEPAAETAPQPGSHGSNTSYTKCDHGKAGVTWTEVTKATGLPTTTGHYVLKESITVASGSMVSIPTAADITLCLNGYTITGGSRIYKLATAGGKLTICDCTAHTDAEGNYTAGRLIPGTAEGGAIGVHSDSTFTLEDGIIDGTGITNTATSGGGAIIATTNNATVNITGGVIRNCHAARGGAIYLYKGKLNMSGGTLKDNVSNTTGGAISTRAADSDGVTEMNITGGKITGNQAKHGGGVFLQCAKSVKLQDATITGNIATVRGGGVDNQTSNTSPAVTVGGKLVVNGNYVGKAEQNLNSVSGARMLKISTEKPLENGAMIGISTQALAVTGSTAVTAATTQADVSSYFFSDMGHSVVMKDNKVTLQARTTHTAHPTGSSWSSTTTLPKTTGNYYLTSNLYLTGSTSVDSAQTITLCLNGYSIYGATGARIYRLSKGANVTLCDCTAHNDANGNYVAGKVVPGTLKGGVVGMFRDATTDAAPTFNFEGGIIDGTGVKDAGTGSAFRIEGHGTVNIKGGEIRNCTNSEGVVSLTAGTVHMSGGKITGNPSRAVLLTNGTFKMSGGEISNNNFTGTEGSGIRMQAGTLEMTGGKITGNTANTSAGIRVQAGTVTLSGGEISGNKAKIAPALLVLGGTVTIKDNMLITGNNETVTESGQVQQNGGTINMQGGKITGFTVTGNLCGSVVLKGGTFKLSGGEISGNTGRGVLIAGGKLVLSENGKVTKNNYTANDGAGVRINSGTFEMTGGEVSNNTSGGSSGAGMRLSGGTATLSGGKITGNSSSGGAGIVVAGGTLNLSGTEISNNKATKNGGGLYIMGGTVNMTGGKITGNEAVSGAGVYATKGAVTMNGVTITGNKASLSSGGADIAAAATFKLGGKTQITGNTAGGKTSNLYMGNGLVFTGLGLDAEAKIGLAADLQQMYATGKLQLGNDVKAEELACFVNDMNGGHTLKVEENKLYVIQNKDSVHTDHTKDECGHTDATWKPWTNFTGLPTTTGHYYLTGDVTLSATAGVSTAQEITLCLNGFDVKQTTEGQRIYRLSGGAILHLCDCKAHTTKDGSYVSGKLTGGSTTAGGGAGAIYASDAGTQFHMYSGTIAGNKTEGSGGAVAMLKNSEMTMSGGKITGNQSVVKGGGVYVSAAKFTMTGGEITGNKSEAGAGISLMDGQLELKDGKITKNTATIEGGAMHMMRTTFKMTGGTITGNKAERSGNIVLGSGAEATITGGTITDNYAKNYAGAFILQGTGPKLTLKDVTLSGNKSINGGAIYVSAETSQLDVDGVTFKKNTADYGGAIRMAGGTVTIRNTTFTENKGNLEGGAVLNMNSELKLENCTFTKNTATNSGAALVLGSGSKTTVSGGTISNHTGPKYGGAIILQGKGPQLTMDDVTVSGNKAKEGGSMYIGAVDGQVTITGSTFKNNEGEIGGAIRVRGGNIKVKDSEFTGNKATGEGGALNIMNSTASLINTDFTKNTAAITGGAVTIGSGAKVTISGGDFSKNSTPKYAGAIMIQGQPDTPPTVRISKATFQDNSAKNGGAFYTARGTVTMERVTFKNNSADYGGAGRQAGGKLILRDITVQGNTADADGAGLLIMYGQCSIENAKFADNVATGTGGGLILGSGSDTKITGATFTGNKSFNGGGLLVQGSPTKLTMTDAKFDGNTVTASGGGMYIGGNDNVVHLKDITVTNNKADGSAGGACSGGGIRLGSVVTVTMENVSVSGNSVIGNGGGLHAFYRDTLTMKNCKFFDNYASGYGGGLSFGTLCILRGDNVEVYENTAGGNGGGLFFDTSCISLEMNSSTIRDNTGIIGGGCYISDKTTLKLNDCKITGNKASRGAGAIYASGGVYLTDTSITGNSDNSQKSAVLLTSVGTDGESYIPAVNQFKGKVVIADNVGGELVLEGAAFVNIYGDGLDSGAKILVDRPEGGLTKVIMGPYNYERSEDRYTITMGERSLKEEDPITAEGAEGANAGLGTYLVIGGFVAVVIALWIVAALVWKKNKNKVRERIAKSVEDESNK